MSGGTFRINRVYIRTTKPRSEIEQHYTSETFFPCCSFWCCLWYIASAHAGDLFSNIATLSQFCLLVHIYIYIQNLKILVYFQSSWYINFSFGI